MPMVRRAARAWQCLVKERSDHAPTPQALALNGASLSTLQPISANAAEGICVLSITNIDTKVFRDETGIPDIYPGLLVEGQSFQPLTQYFTSLDPKPSVARLLKIRRYTKDLLHYAYLNFNTNAIEFLQVFKHRYRTGTNSVDLTQDQLGWRSKSVQTVDDAISELSRFFDYLVKNNPSIPHPNPKTRVTDAEQILLMAAAKHRSAKSLLGHLWDGQVTDEARTIRHSSRFLVSPNPPRFPDDRFEELILKGFLTRRGYDYRAALITLLMHGGGIRASEAIHLYFDDVKHDPINPQFNDRGDPPPRVRSRSRSI